MNFLAHHMVSIYPQDYYYNLGLTLPDILSMQNSKCRIYEKDVDNKLLSLKDHLPLFSLFSGMKIHLQLDKWFHNSNHFYHLMKEASSIINVKYFPVHQFVEILFDIYIDSINKQYAKSMMEIYKDKRLDNLLINLKNIYEINEVNFNRLKNYIAEGKFYESYLDNNKLLVLIQKLAITNKKRDISLEIENTKELIDETKKILKNSFDDFYKDLLKYSADIQIKLKENELNCDNNYKELM